MKVISEVSYLSSFEFWSGAKDNAMMLNVEELDELGDMLEDIYPDGISDVQLNDIVRFDFGWCCEMLNLDYDEEENIIRR